MDQPGFEDMQDLQNDFLAGVKHVESQVAVVAPSPQRPILEVRCAKKNRFRFDSIRPLQENNRNPEYPLPSIWIGAIKQEEILSPDPVRTVLAPAKKRPGEQGKFRGKPEENDLRVVHFPVTDSRTLTQIPYN